MIARGTVYALVLLLLCFCTVPGYAGQDEKEIPVQQEAKPVTQDEWQIFYTGYAWLPSALVDVNVPNVRIGNRTIGGEFSIDQPWWETLSKFSSDFYVLTLDARLEVWKGRWGGFIDGYWLFGKSTVGNSDSRLVLRDRVDVTASSSVTSRFDTGQVNFGPQFKLGTAALGGDCFVSFILYGGGRVNWIGNDLDGTLTIRASANIGEIGQTFHFSSSNSRAFIEPMIGFKTGWAFGNKFQAILRGDVGGFGFVDANNWDCDLEAGIAWEFRRHTYLDVGYRARGQWQDLGSKSDSNLSGWFFGPELGMTFSF
jgi:hypothetical protein